MIPTPLCLSYTTRNELYTSIMTAQPQIFCVLFLFWWSWVVTCPALFWPSRRFEQLSLILVGPKPDKSIMYIYRMITCPAAAQLGWQRFVVFSPYWPAAKTNKPSRLWREQCGRHCGPSLFRCVNKLYRKRWVEGNL